jgi:alpha-beta hydrolase superfamily lysophospholipase
MANVEIKHHTANIKNFRMHYTVAGSGEIPVLLLHGWPHTAFGWREVQGLLASDYTVIAPDLRGQGYSNKPETGYDADNLADDFYELMRHLGYTEAYRVVDFLERPLFFFNESGGSFTDLLKSANKTNINLFADSIFLLTKSANTI